LDLGQHERERSLRQRQRVLRDTVLDEGDGIGGKIGAQRGGLAVIGLVHPDDRERFAPIALTREEPVAQLVVDRGLADALGGEVGGDFLLGVGPVHPVVAGRVDELAVAGIG